MNPSPCPRPQAILLHWKILLAQSNFFTINSSLVYQCGYSRSTLGGLTRDPNPGDEEPNRQTSRLNHRSLMHQWAALPPHMTPSQHLVSSSWVVYYVMLSYYWIITNLIYKFIFRCIFKFIFRCIYIYILIYEINLSLKYAQKFNTGIRELGYNW